MSQGGKTCSTIFEGQCSAVGTQDNPKLEAIQSSWDNCRSVQGTIQDHFVQQMYSGLDTLFDLPGLLEKSTMSLASKGIWTRRTCFQEASAKGGHNLRGFCYSKLYIFKLVFHFVDSFRCLATPDFRRTISMRIQKLFLDHVATLSILESFTTFLFSIIPLYFRPKHLEASRLFPQLWHCSSVTSQQFKNTNNHLIRAMKSCLM